MSLTPEQTTSLVEGVITLLGLLAIFLRMQINDAQSKANHEITQTKIDSIEKKIQ